MKRTIKDILKKVVLFLIAILLILFFLYQIFHPNLFNIKEPSNTSIEKIDENNGIIVGKKDTSNIKEVKKYHSSGIIIFNNTSYKTYNTKDEALENIILLPEGTIRGTTVTGVPGENIQRIQFWVDYVSNKRTNRFTGFEKFLFPDNNWSTDVDLSSYAGETIVIAILCSTGDLIPKSMYNYVAFEIPKNQEQETETENPTIEDVKNESVSESESETTKTPSDELGIGPGFEL